MDVAVSLLQKLTDVPLAFLDVETTGASAEYGDRVIELASFNEFNETHQSFLDQLMESVGIVLNTIAATMRTEGLLKQSQLLTQELQARQTELTRKQQELHATNEELQEKAQLLENEKKQVEGKNIEIEMARRRTSQPLETDPE